MDIYPNLDWLADPCRLAFVSPQIALAVAEGVPLAPMVLSCKATFTSAGQTIPSVALENGQGSTISQATLVTGVSVQVDQPNLNTGNFLKSVNDVAYEEQAGIQAMMDVVGTPRFTISQFYQPVRVLRDMINRHIQFGWCFNGTQSIRMNMQSDASITPPTNVTFAFLMLQPAGTDKYIYLSDTDAIAALAKLGVPLPQYVVNRKGGA